MSLVEAKEHVRREYYDDGGTTFSGTPLSNVVEDAIDRFVEVAALDALQHQAETADRLEQERDSWERAAGDIEDDRA